VDRKQKHDGRLAAAVDAESCGQEMRATWLADVSFWYTAIKVIVR
jgi:hypothetical protein